MKTTKARKRKRAAAVACTVLFGDGTGRRIVGILTTEVGKPSDGKPVHFKSASSVGAVLPIKGSVAFKSVVQLDDGTRWSIGHVGITGHPPTEDCILRAAATIPKYFSPEPHSPNAPAQRPPTTDV